MAALALARLGALTGTARYTTPPVEVVDMFGELLARHPTAFAHTVLTADLLATGCTEVVVTGDRPDLVDVVRAGGGPRRSWPGASRPPRRCGQGGTATVPTCAGTTRASCRPRTPRPCRRSWRPRPVDRGRPVSTPSTRTPRSGTARDVVRAVKPRGQIEVGGGTSLTVLVLACHAEDTTGVDLASGTLVRVRVDWPEDHGPDLAPFDVVEAQLAEEPERDDLAQPEAVTATGLPRHLGTLHGRRVRRLLHQLAAPVEEHVLGFPGASAPYWEFRGFRPSLALVGPDQGPGAVPADRGPVRLGPLRLGPERQLAARSRTPGPTGARRRPSGPADGQGPGLRPRLQAPLPGGRHLHPRDGHCYKTVRALLPRS